jgi:hypothetical protein
MVWRDGRIDRSTVRIPLCSPFSQRITASHSQPTGPDCCHHPAISAASPRSRLVCSLPSDGQTQGGISADRDLPWGGWPLPGTRASAWLCRRRLSGRLVAQAKCAYPSRPSAGARCARLLVRSDLRSRRRRWCPWRLMYPRAQPAPRSTVHANAPRCRSNLARNLSAIAGIVLGVLLHLRVRLAALCRSPRLAPIARACSRPRKK